MPFSTLKTHQTNENGNLPTAPYQKIVQRLSSKTDRLEEWELEILSCLISLFTMGLIVTVAYFLDDKPLPTWPMGLTPNTVVSSLGEISKAALIFPVAEAIGQLKWVWFRTGERRLTDFELYDLASRGPSGSLKLLLRPRLWNMVSLGALITLLATGLGPSLQQTLVYSSVNTTVDSTTAIVARADAYYGLEPFDLEISEGYIIENSMRGAIYGGLFGDAPSPINTPTCSTGNCTWDEYTSLGVCHDCRNITSTLKLNPSREEDTHSSEAWLAPNGFRFDAGYIMKTSTVLPPLNYSGLKHPILLLTSAFYPGGLHNLDEPPTAHECILFFCVNTYRSRSTGGNFSEETVKSWPQPNSTKMNGYLDGSDFLPVKPTEWPSEVRVTNFSENYNYTINCPGDSVYMIETRTFSYLRDTLGWLLRAEHKIVNGLPQKDFTELIRAIYIAMDGSSSSLPTMIAKIAISMTNTVRNKQGLWTGSVESQPAIGITTKLETRVQIRWLWLLAAIGIVLLGCSFLCVTIRVTSKAHLSSWKSSALAVMSIGLDEKLRSNMTVTGETLNDYERCAGEALVRLSGPGDTDLLNAPDGRDAQDTSEAPDAPENVDIRHSLEMTDSLDTRQSLNTRQSLDTRQSLETTESLDTRRSLDIIESLDLGRAWTSTDRMLDS